MLILFTDTDTDITPSEAQAFGYRLISMPYSVDGKTVYPYEDFDTFDCHAFYDTLRGGVLPTTSAISVGRYTSYFEPIFQNGDDILYVHFSAAMTMTFDCMRQAVDALLQKYPQRKFYTVDTKGITIESLNIVKEIGDLHLGGATAEQILDWASREVDRFATYFFADDLRFFHRSGRVGGLSATMGTLLGVRPIINMNDEGKMVSVGKERGRGRALERLVTEVESLGDDVKAHRILIGHTDALPLAQQLGDMLCARLGDDLRIEYVAVNPTAGSHCGPDAVGVCFHAKHR